MCTIAHNIVQDCTHIVQDCTQHCAGLHTLCTTAATLLRIVVWLPHSSVYIYSAAQRAGVSSRPPHHTRRPTPLLEYYTPQCQPVNRRTTHLHPRHTTPPSPRRHTQAAHFRHPHNTSQTQLPSFLSVFSYVIVCVCVCVLACDTYTSRWVGGCDERSSPVAHTGSSTESMTQPGEC